MSCKQTLKILNISRKVGKGLESEKKEMRNQTHLGSSAARKLPFLHSVQNIFNFYYQTFTQKSREQ